uniref:LamG-like jellyroll fold domain-containing protein n=1 Tax=viral metagenome TaxID=1070528 RepID=A0A6C0B7A7_9ZZZZ
MSITVIALGILLLVLIYVLYLYLTPNYVSLINSASLLSNTPPLTGIDMPNSPRYAYGLWLYVNSWNNTSENKYIFTRNNNIQLYLDKTQLNLYLDVYMNTGTGVGAWLSSIKAPILITDNYPIQKWCYIVISVDSAFIDCYLDGKLILSQKTYLPNPNSGSALTNVYPAMPPDIGQSSSVNSGNSMGSGANIILGGTDSGGVSQPTYTNFDAAVNKFMRWSTPVNPQIVWDTYIAGNGSSNGIMSSFSSYNAKLDILKNHAAYTSFSLF